MNGKVWLAALFLSLAALGTGVAAFVACRDRSAQSACASARNPEGGAAPGDRAETGKRPPKSPGGVSDETIRELRSPRKIHVVSPTVVGGERDDDDDSDYDDEDHPYSPTDKKLAKALDAAMEAYNDAPDEDSPAPGKTARESAELRKAALDKALQAVAAAGKSANPSVRQRAIEAASDIGGAALPELTGMVADPDPDVAEAALDASETALNEIEDLGIQFAVAAKYMEVFASNEDALSTFASIANTAGNDLLDVENQVEALSRRRYVIDTLEPLIAHGGNLASEAKDAYSFITGEDWISRAEADRWAADPDNYEAPDQDCP